MNILEKYNYIQFNYTNDSQFKTHGYSQFKTLQSDLIESMYKQTIFMLTASILTRFTNLSFYLSDKNGNNEKRIIDNKLPIIISLETITEENLGGRVYYTPSISFYFKLQIQLVSEFKDTVFNISHEIKHILDIIEGLDLEEDKSYKERQCEIRANEFAEYVVKELNNTIY